MLKNGRGRLTLCQISYSDVFVRFSINPTKMEPNSPYGWSLNNCSGSASAAQDIPELNERRKTGGIRMEGMHQ